MSGTFACPHCQAVYPVKPVLMGKAVRCTTCRKPFMLGEDGIARPVGTVAISQPAPDQAPAAAEPAPLAQAPIPAAPVQATVPVVPPAVPSPRPIEPASTGSARVELPATQSGRMASAKPSTERRARAQSERFAAVKREMSTTLQSALGEAIKQEEAKAKAGSERVARPQREGPASEGGQGKLGPAALTGEGERGQAETRWWMIGCGGVVAVVLFAAWLMWTPSETGRALADYTAPVSADLTGPGRRIPAIWKRAWLARLPDATRPAPFVDLRQAVAGAGGFIPGRSVSEALADLNDRHWVAALDGWVLTAQLFTAEEQLKKQPASEVIAKAALLGIDLLDRTTLRKRLADRQLDGESAALVEAFLLGEPGENASACDRLRSGGKGLEKIEWRRFSGTSGRLLRDLGGRYESVERPFAGVLVRFVGPGWPKEWRVMALQPLPIAR
ncbi:hypothetical protein LBMAG53_12930 [Planctomycetota bacterium]|nr:hypothetical protein LBMAG53_12930 [Planctomycetota bacterium]